MDEFEGAQTEPPSPVPNTILMSALYIPFDWERLEVNLSRTVSSFYEETTAYYEQNKGLGDVERERFKEYFIEFMDFIKCLKSDFTDGNFGAPNSGKRERFNYIVGKSVSKVASWYMCLCIAWDEYIETEQNSEDYLSVDKRLSMLENFIEVNGSAGFKDFFARLFPEIKSLDLSNANEIYSETTSDNHDLASLQIPDIAPERWSDIGVRQENPPEFITRVYGSWLGKGLTLAHLRQLDRPLYNKFNGWKRTHQLPPGFDLPAKHQQTDRDLSEFEKQTPQTTLKNDSIDSRELLRLAAAKNYRETKRVK